MKAENSDYKLLSDDQLSNDNIPTDPKIIKKDKKYEEIQMIPVKNKSEQIEEKNYPMIKRISEYIPKHDYMFRICIVGDANVGKTSLLSRYCDNVFKESYNNTIGVDFRVITLEYNNLFSKVHIWDTAGQERFKSISVNYFRSTHGFMFVYDITQKNSLANLNTWVEMAFNTNKSSVVNFLVGNKSDLEEERQISREEATDYAAVRKFTFLETSAKNNQNVDKAFEFFTYKLIEYYLKNTKAYEALTKNDDKLKISDMNTVKDIPQDRKKKKCAC